LKWDSKGNKKKRNEDKPIKAELELKYNLYSVRKIVEGATMNPVMQESNRFYPSKMELENAILARADMPRRRSVSIMPSISKSS
jgi:hypothetical protein